MSNARVNPRYSLAGAALSILGAFSICTAAFTSSGAYDTLLLGVGVVAMFSASAVLFLSVRSTRRG